MTDRRPEPDPARLSRPERRRMWMPQWYGRMCREWSLALARGELTDEEVHDLLEHWHPIALDEAWSKSEPWT